MTDVFLISPPYGRSYGNSRRRQRHGLPPLGLASINAFIKSKGYSTRFIDLAFSDLSDDDVVAQLRSFARNVSDFLQIMMAKKAPSSPTEMPLITSEGLSRLMGSLGRAASASGARPIEIPAVTPASCPQTAPHSGSTVQLTVLGNA